MALFWINSRLGADGTRPGAEFLFATRSAQDVDELAALLASAGVVAGERIKVADDKRGGRDIEKRQPIALTREAILSAVPYDPRRLWERLP